MMRTGPRWYVVQTQAGAEHKAVMHLARQGFKTYLPRYLKRRRHARRIDVVAVPLFPRYLFVEIDFERPTLALDLLDLGCFPVGQQWRLSRSRAR
jgi:transcription antitermination factor NusG